MITRYNDAISYCERKIKKTYNDGYVSCKDCYWEDSLRCSKYLNRNPRNCEYFLDDTVHGNWVKKNILSNPQLIKQNWDLLDDYDKRIFLIINGSQGV